MDKKIITRTEDWHRQYVINGVCIRKICIYDKTGIIFDTGTAGWIEEYLTITKMDLKSICIDTPKKANKVNFERTDNFYITAYNYFNEKQFILYINRNNIDVEFLGTEQTEMTEGYFYKYNMYKLTCKNGCYVVDYKGQEKTSFIVKSFDKTIKTDKTTEYDTVKNNIKEKYNVDIYSIEKARQVYTELKAFFEKYE